MAGVILGSEALARGSLTRGQLRWNYRRIHPDVYLPKSATRSLWDDINAAWLWSGRRDIIAGRAAAALHGAKWVDDFTPIEVAGPFHHRPLGVIVRRERISAEEVVELQGLPVTSLARTAFDLGRHLPRTAAVANLDALSAATGLTRSNVDPLIALYRGARGVRRCQAALALMDGGAQSPKEKLVAARPHRCRTPRPVTQIRVSDGNLVAYLDMGWEEPMVALEYDGDQHRTDRRQYVKDIRRGEMVDRFGWHVIKVINEDRPNLVIRRVQDALARRATARLPRRL